MSWSVTDRFPSWGETGESPGSGFFYEGGDQVNEKHLDYLWNSLKGLEDDVQAALSDIDSNSDGVVDKADGGAAGFSLDGDLVAAGGETIWDESANYIPQNRLQNDSVTINGSTVALGGSTTISAYSDSDARDAINTDSDHGSTASHNYFSGSHDDLSSVGSNDHHSKTTSASELTDVSPDSDSNAHHSRYSDSEARTAVDGANINISGDADTVDGQDASQLGGIALQSTDNVRIETVDKGLGLEWHPMPSNDTLLGGSAATEGGVQWKIHFNDGNIIDTGGKLNMSGEDAAFDDMQIATIPPAKNVNYVEVKGDGTIGGYIVSK